MLEDTFSSRSAKVPITSIRGPVIEPKGTFPVSETLEPLPVVSGLGLLVNVLLCL